MATLAYVYERKKRDQSVGGDFRGDPSTEGL